MKSFALALACALLLSCSNPPSAPRPPLDGSWQLATVKTPMDPHSLKLSQHDTIVTGTGTAYGVDVPMPVSVQGTALLPTVTLTFIYGTYDPATARYTATLQSDGTLVGEVVYSSPFLPLTDSLTFTRK